MKKYLEDLKNELKKRNVCDQEIEEILADHIEMIAEAIAEGLSEEEIQTKFGTPEKLASDIAEDTQKVDIEPTNHSSMTVLKTFPVPVEPLNVTVKLVSEDIRIETGKESEIVVYYEGKLKTDYYRCQLVGDELSLIRTKEADVRLFGGFRHEEVKFLVVLPKTASIKHLDHLSVSSDIALAGMKARSISVNSTSGDLDVENLATGDSKLSTVSGDITLHNVTAETFNLSVVSGDAKISSLSVKGEIRANTVSGDLEFDDTESKNAAFHTVSGDIVGTEFYPMTLSLSSVSGDINITNKDHSRRISVLNKHTVSGDINININTNR
jgi:DUF4097 and DUF4098 domain-containing protein YvlB